MTVILWLNNQIIKFLNNEWNDKKIKWLMNETIK